MANDELSAGFTGKPTEPPTGVRKIAKVASGAVGREANAVVVGPQITHTLQQDWRSQSAPLPSRSVIVWVDRQAKRAEVTGDRGRAMHKIARRWRAAGVDASCGGACHASAEGDWMRNSPRHERGFFTVSDQYAF